MRLSRRIALTIAAPLVLVVGISAAIGIPALRDQMHRDNMAWASTLVSALAETLSDQVARGDVLAVQNELRGIRDNQKSIIYLFVVGFDGKVFAHTFQNGMPPDLVSRRNDGRSSAHYKTESGRVLEVRQPLIRGLAGKLHIGLAEDEMQQALRVLTWDLALALFVVMVLAVFIGHFTSVRVAYPLELLARHVSGLGRQEAQQQGEIVLPTTVSEVELLSDAVNEMQSQRRAYTTELTASRESMRRAQAIAHVGNWEWDITSGGLLWSDEVYRIFGYEPQAFAASYEAFLEAIHPDDRNAVTQAVGRAVEAADNIYDIEHRILRPDGDLRYVREQGSVLRDGDTAVYMIGVVHDITDRKKAEQKIVQAHGELEEKVQLRTRELVIANEKLQELDKLKSMFIATMSHELRTPLNSIIGFSGVLAQGLAGELNSTQSDQLRRIRESARHLLALISDIIDISKIEAGRMDVDIERVAIQPILQQAVDSARPYLADRNVEIDNSGSDAFDLVTDSKRLLQVLINILSNAAKYTEQGRISITASKSDGEMQLVVSDTGVGIASKDMDRIFEAFERVENVLSVKSGGTGLGLYLTSKIIRDLLQGRIEIQSRAGVGTTVTIVVPDYSEQLTGNARTVA